MSVALPFRVSDDLRDRVDAWAKERSLNRNRALTELVELGLDERKAAPLVRRPPRAPVSGPVAQTVSDLD